LRSTTCDWHCDPNVDQSMGRRVPFKPAPTAARCASTNKCGTHAVARRWIDPSKVSSHEVQRHVRRLPMIDPSQFRPPGWSMAAGEPADACRVPRHAPFPLSSRRISSPFTCFSCRVNFRFLSLFLCSIRVTTTLILQNTRPPRPFDDSVPLSHRHITNVEPTDHPVPLLNIHWL
jgi:hypothetical protein